MIGIGPGTANGYFRLNGRRTVSVAQSPQAMLLDGDPWGYAVMYDSGTRH
jgi:hypothetical protein